MGKREESPPAKRSRPSTGNEWLRSWAWKREHRPDKVRFDRPYTHSLKLPDGSASTLTVHQQRFKEQGFASTVWDSSIVVAKWAEKHAQQLAGQRVLDLSAGCGLVALTAARLGAARVVATDLGPNMPLLRKNAEANGCHAVEVLEHTWGDDLTPLGGPFDLVAACDLMYISEEEVVAALVKTLASAVAPGGQVLLAHGRNRGAEPTFLAEARRQGLRCLEVHSPELDSVFQCADVSVWRLQPKQQASGAVAGSGDGSSGTANVGGSSKAETAAGSSSHESSFAQRAAQGQQQQESNSEADAAEQQQEAAEKTVRRLTT